MNTSDMVQCLPFNIAWYNHQSKLVSATNSALETIGFASLEQAVGVSYGDFNCRAADAAEEFCKQDMRVLHGESLKLVSVSKWANSNNLAVHLVEKKLWLDKDENILGTVCVCHDISDTSIATDFMHYYTISSTKEAGVYYEVFTAEDRKNSNLSDREWQCLFLILRGRTAKVIARILNISPRTVEHHIDSLKNKLQCTSKDQLIDVAICKGLAYSIPSGLIG